MTALNVLGLIVLGTVAVFVGWLAFLLWVVRAESRGREIARDEYGADGL